MNPLEASKMIPLVDLQAQYATIKKEVDSAVMKVLASGQFALGSEVTNFEEEKFYYGKENFKNSSLLLRRNINM